MGIKSAMSFRKLHRINDLFSQPNKKLQEKKKKREMEGISID